MNFREVMNELDKIWDFHNHQMLENPNYPQFKNENWRVKICTSDSGWGAVPGTYIKSIFEGIDWDANTILVRTTDPIWLEPPNIPTHKLRNNINGVSYECPSCHKFVGKDDKYCKHCGKAFSGEIKDGVIFE